MSKLILFLTIFLTGLGSANAQTQQEQLMPSWQLKTQAGESVSSEDLLGKPLILHFWATWCPFCKKLQPGLDKLYSQYKDQGLQFVAVSFREDPGTKPQDVLDARGHSFTTLVDGDEVAMGKFAVRGTPTTFFIYADGRVLGVTGTSNPDEPGLEKAVQTLIADYQKQTQ